MEDLNEQNILFRKTAFNYEATEDNHVSAAQGEADESTPAVFVWDAPGEFIDGGRGYSADSYGEAPVFCVFF